MTRQARAPIGCLVNRQGAASYSFVSGGVAQQRCIAAHYHQQIIKIVGNAAGELPDRFHSLGLPQRRLGLFAFLDLEMQATIDQFELTRTFIDYSLDTASVAGAEQQQCSQKASAADARGEDRPALPLAMPIEVGKRRSSGDTVLAAAEGEHVLICRADV